MQDRRGLPAWILFQQDMSLAGSPDPVSSHLGPEMAAERFFWCGRHIVDHP
jgi:hypothetical protein